MKMASHDLEKAINDELMKIIDEILNDKNDTISKDYVVSIIGKHIKSKT